MLEILNLRKEYKGRHSASGRLVLNDINLTIADKGLIVVCGKSGSGKSTLMHLIGGLDKPTSGRILYNGTDIAHLKESELDGYRNRCIGFVSQDYGLIASLTVADNCLLPVRLQEKDDCIAVQRISKALAQVGLAGFERRRINTLSGGEKQRVAIARALAQNSKLLLCDEPTGNLDPENANTVFRILKKLSEQICVLVVTHDYHLGEKYADRVVSLQDGRIDERSLFNTPKINNGSRLASQASDLPKSELWKEKRPHFGGKGLLSLFLMQLKSRLIVAIALLLILSVLFSVLLASENVKEYSRADAISSTLKDYRVSFLKISPYEVLFDENEKEYYTQFLGVTNLKDIMPDLEAQNSEAVFGRSYMLTNTLRDFFPEANLPVRSKYWCGAFLHYISVDSFSEYRPELLCGDYPKESEDVLIYDYMAENILHFCELPDIFQAEQLLGYTLEKEGTGLRMRISGIMKSNFRDCAFMDTEGWEETVDRKKRMFFESYLSSLRSVVGFPSLIEAITAEQNCISTFGMVLNMSKPGDAYQTELYTDVSQIQIAYYGTDLGLVYQNPDNSVYYCISDTLLSELTGLSREELTDEKIQELFHTEDFGGFPWYASTWTDYECVLESGNDGYSIDGVFRSEECTVYLYEEKKDSLSDWHKQNGLYEYPVLLLSADARKNGNIIESLLLPYGEELQSGNVGSGGFAICTYFEILLNEADAFLEDFGAIAARYYWIVLIAVLLLLTAYIVFMIQKNQYSIGVMKSVGVPDGVIAAGYGTYIIVITMLAVLLSLAGSVVFVSFVNSVFSDTVGVPFRFFSFCASSVWKTLAVAGSAVLLSLLTTFIVFLTRKPVRLKNAE